MLSTLARLRKTQDGVRAQLCDATRLLSRDFVKQNRLKNRFSFVFSNGHFL